jgi:hypothetical protein
MRKFQFHFAALVAGVIGVTVLLMSSEGEPHPLPHFRLPTERQSTDLQQDRALMWETKDGWSTVAGIHAAHRVFGTIDLLGKTKSQVFDLVGDPSILGSPIHMTPWSEVKRGDLFYRFDNGAWGMQFTIRFDWRGKVKRVECWEIE